MGKIDLLHIFCQQSVTIFQTIDKIPRKLIDKHVQAQPIYLFEPTTEKSNFLPFDMTTG